MTRSRFPLAIHVAALLTVLSGCARQAPLLAAPAQQAKPADAPAETRDQSRRLLEKLLLPSETLPPLPAESISGPRHFLAARELEPPDLRLSQPDVALPKVPGLFPHTRARPRALPEGSAAFMPREEPTLPRRVELPATPRVRVPSVDVNQPVPLPHLGQYRTESAPAEEPTADASQATALASPPAQRAGPAPFVPLNLPEPYEHRRQRPAGPEEDAVLPIIPPRRPDR